MKDHKEWNKLQTLDLNATGLTDDGLIYLMEAPFPKLKVLNIIGNKFTDISKPKINSLRMK